MSFWTSSLISTLQDYISKNSKLLPLSISHTDSLNGCNSVNIEVSTNVIIQIVDNITCNGVVIHHDKNILFLNKYICEALLYIKKSLFDKLILAPISIDTINTINTINTIDTIDTITVPPISIDTNKNINLIHIEQLSPLYTRNLYASNITVTINDTNNTTTYQLSNVHIDYHCHNYTSLWLYWHKIINALISSSVIDNATNKYNFELKKELDSLYRIIDKEFNKSFTDGVQTYLKYQKYNHICVVDTDIGNSCSICDEFSTSYGHLIKLLISKLNQCDCNVIKLNTLL
jgi:hypothetical protein